MHIDAPAKLTLAVPELKDGNLHEIRCIEAHTPSDRLITIQHDDAKKSMQRLELLIMDRVLKDEEFLAVLRTYYPPGPNADKEAALVMLESFFTLVTLYLQRTTTNAPRTISTQQLRAELKVYAWSGFEEWVENHCGKRVYEEVMSRMEHRAFLMESSGFGMPGVVSRFWLECLDDVVGTLVWRDDGVKRSEAAFEMDCYAPWVAGVGLTIAAVYRFGR